MSHFGYALLFVLASSLVASVLQAKSKEEFQRYFLSRFLTPLGALVGVSWVMFVLGKL